MAQSILKLRKKVEEKSREADLFKRKYLEAVLLNESLLEDAKDIARLKDLLRSRDSKIVILNAEIQSLKIFLHHIESSSSTKIPFIKETEHALFCAEHSVVGAPTNFSEDSEAFEAMLSKAAHRQKSGVDYNPDSVSFKAIAPSGISDFVKELCKTKPFTYLQAQFIENTFGEDKTSFILDMCSACSIEVYELQPLKKA